MVRAEPLPFKQPAARPESSGRYGQASACTGCNTAPGKAGHSSPPLPSGSLALLGWPRPCRLPSLLTLPDAPHFSHLALLGLLSFATRAAWAQALLTPGQLRRWQHLGLQANGGPGPTVRIMSVGATPGATRTGPATPKTGWFRRTRAASFNLYEAVQRARQRAAAK
jgi:hypothetical protein